MPARIHRGAASARARPRSLEPCARLSARARLHLNRWIPALGPAGSRLPALTERLTTLLDQPAEIAVEECPRIMPHAPARSGRVTFALELAPQGPPLQLLVDADLAAALVDALLGGAGDRPAVPRPVSTLERGALGYLVLLACRSLAERGGPTVQLLGLDEPAEAPGSGPYLIVPIRIRLGSLQGWLRLALPLDVPPPALPVEPGTDGPLAPGPLTLRAEVGGGPLPLGELAALAPGDVLFTERLTLDPSTSTGQARLLCGPHPTQALICEVDSNASSWRLVPSQTLTIPPLENTMTDTPTNPTSADDTVHEAPTEEALAAPLLEDVPVQVSLELGRITLTARELLSLRAGQVVEIDRTSGDPLALSANGKVIAEGELVEIEGRMGLRIARLVGT